MAILFGHCEPETLIHAGIFACIELRIAGRKKYFPVSWL